LPMQDEDDNNALHAIPKSESQPENKENAAPIVPDVDEELPPDIPKTESNEQQQVQMDDNDQIMADNDVSMKDEAETQMDTEQPMPMQNEQVQPQQEIKQQMPTPMDTDERTTQPVVTKEQQIKTELIACTNMLTEFMKRVETEPFNAPVDWEGLNLPDYPQFITRPMDLGTVSGKLSNGKYANAEKFAADVRLVFKNAMTYNEDGSGIYVVAENLSKQFERRYARITKESTMKKRKQMNSQSTFGQRQQFTNLIQQLTPQELGGIVEVIDKKCPQALKDNFGAEDANDDEIEIEVYNIEGTILIELIAFVEKTIAKRGKKKSRRLNY